MKMGGTMLIYVEFDAQCDPFNVLTSFAEDVEKIECIHAASWKKIDFSSHSEHALYIISNLQKNSYFLNIIQDILESGIRFVIFENHFSICHKQSGACFEDSSVRNCCQLLRIESFRSLYEKAIFIVFKNKKDRDRTFEILGNVVKDSIVESDLEVALKTIKSIGVDDFDHHKIDKDRYRKTFVYKTVTGLGDIFLALPEIGRAHV